MAAIRAAAVTIPRDRRDAFLREVARGRRLGLATFRASPVHPGEQGKADGTIAE